MEFTQPDLRPVLWKGRVMYVFAEPWRFMAAGKWQRVKKNVLIDLASVPRLFWTLTGYTPDGLYRAGAAAHDVLYALLGLLDDGTRLTRAECDQVLTDHMRAAGVHEHDVAAFHFAVRVFGWLSWRKEPGKLEFYKP